MGVCVETVVVASAAEGAAVTGVVTAGATAGAVGCSVTGGEGAWGYVEGALADAPGAAWCQCFKNSFLHFTAIYLYFRRIFYRF